MARKSIEDVMNEIEDFLNSCKTTALSSNKVVVPRDEFDELFGELKVKIPAEIDRCKKIMRNKEAILMDARKTADGILAQATEQASQMVSETEIMTQANQKAYETVEMARVQANEILAQAVAEANEIRLGSMQYTNDIMLGIRNYVEATMQAERANYENLIEALNNDYRIANANIEEIQNQIVEFTGDPNSVQGAPQIRAAAAEKPAPKAKTSMVQKVKQAVGGKEDKNVSGKTAADVKPSVKKEAEIRTSAERKGGLESPNSKKVSEEPASTESKVKASASAVSEQTAAGKTTANTDSAAAGKTTAEGTRKVKKKIVKRRNPVIHTPQTAQETVAKTLEAAAAAKVDKTVYKANGEQAREVQTMEGRVKRGPRVGRGMVEEHAENNSETAAQTAVPETENQGAAKSLGVVDDLSMEEKF